MASESVPAVSLEMQAVLAAAREKAGLADFGAEQFVPPLRALLQSLDSEAQLCAVGRYGQYTRIVDLLVNRLQFRDWVKRFPQILDEPIAPPIVIVGLMRTGTTMLQRLMACDQRFYTPLWYETRYPVPASENDFKGPDSRIPPAKAEVAQMLAANPDLASMHPLDACAPDEEVMLLEQSFYSTLPESFAWLPGYARWLETHDNTPGYRYLYQLLQFLQWQKKRKGQRATRWLLKAPHHLHHLDLLLRVFPGATVIQTHRDPLQTIPSLCSLNFALASLGSDAVDKVAFARHWSDKFARSMARAIAVRDQYPDQFIDVRYKDIVSDPIGVVQQLYERLSLELDARAATAMERWLRDNKREDRQPHRYTPEQFGLTPEGLCEDFRAYRAAYIGSAPERSPPAER